MQSPLKACLLNPWSVVNKATTLHDFILEYDLDILALTETWLSGTVCDGPVLQEMLPNGYNYIHTPRKSRGGGIALVYRDVIPVKKSVASWSWSTFEILESTISMTSHIKLSIVYRPERSRAQCDGATFINEFNEYLSAAVSSPGHLLLLGDFNYHVDDSNDCRANEFLRMVTSFGLCQSVFGATHRSGHTLDIVLTEENQQIISPCKPLDCGFPDHFPVFFDVLIAKPLRPKKEITYRRTKNITKAALQEVVRSSPLSDPDSYSALSLNQLVDSYNTELIRIIDNMAPVRQKTITVREESQWFNEEIRRAKQKRRQYERLWRKTNLTVHREMFVLEKNHVTALIVEAKQAFYRDAIASCRNDTRKLFQLTSSLLSEPTASTLLTTDSPNLLAQTFSEFFISKISTIQKSIPSADNTPSSLQFPLTDAVFDDFSAIDEVQLKKLIARSATKHCDLDPLPTSLLKLVTDELAPIICTIVNTSLQNGVFPDVYKTAIVVPRLKKPSLDPEEKANYRPISNLSFLSKIIERAAADQLMQYLTHNGLQEPYQSAYKPQHSTETLLAHVHNNILRDIAQKKVVLLALLDLSAAFDTVNHRLLLEILGGLGIGGTALAWFTSYLSERQQKIKINDVMSEAQDLTCGVPQGSVLGPILFGVYTSSLGRLLRSENVNYHLYADDSQIYLSANPEDLDEAITKMESCINRVHDWMNKHCLKMNMAKTDFIIISSKHASQSFTPKPIQVDGHSIEPSAKVKNLGVTMDRYLNMEAHVNALCRNAYYQLKNIARLRRYMDTASMETLVHAFVTTRLDYSNSLLYGISRHLLAKLQRVQNTAARVLKQTRKHEHITPVLKALHWLPVEMRISFKILVLTFKCVSNLCPQYLCDTVTLHVPSRDLRSSSLMQLNVPFTQSHFYQNSAFSIVAPNLWNALPFYIRNSESLNIFKGKLKTHLFNLYYS